LAGIVQDQGSKIEGLRWLGKASGSHDEGNRAVQIWHAAGDGHACFAVLRRISGVKRTEKWTKIMALEFLACEHVFLEGLHRNDWAFSQVSTTIARWAKERSCSGRRTQL
jgi:hypothetical protein